MGFFTVPTLTFGILYCFFVIAHERRRILHWNVTSHPSSEWAVQQLREAFPYDHFAKYLIFDPLRSDAIFAMHSILETGNSIGLAFFLLASKVRNWHDLLLPPYS